MNHEYKTGIESGLISCPHCELISRLPLPETTTASTQKSSQTLICSRCDAHLHSRIPDSLNKTAALVFAACFMYIPANILPIMNITYLGSGQADTIIGGTLHLLEEGMWPLALIVFVASIVVPILKLFVMTGLLISVKLRSHWRPVQRTHLFHIIEFIGRWSMVDIFVLAILVALVQFGNIASVDAGLGALSFAMVVMLTMFAAHTFDPRLIWDVMDDSKRNESEEIL
ncbi:MAG: paraquat-inducible protein A [Thiotrichaceae bacterium]